MNFKKNIPLILILSLAFIIRLIAVLKQELWVDEAYSIYAIKFFQFPYDVVHPPFYYLTLKFWGIVSNNIIWLRSLSLIFSILSLYFYFKLLKLIFKENFALFATFFLTISAFHIHYSWQIRMYSLIFFLTTYSLYLFFLIIKRLNNKKSLNFKLPLLFSMINLIGSLTDFSFLLYLLCLGSFLLVYFLKKTSLSLFKKERWFTIFLLTHLIIPITTFALLNNKSGDINSLINFIPSFNLKNLLINFAVLNNYSSNKLSFYFLILLFLILIYGLIKLIKINKNLFYLTMAIIAFPISLCYLFEKIFNVSIFIPRVFTFVHLFFQLIISLTIFYSFFKKNERLFLRVLFFFLSLFLIFYNIVSNIFTNFNSFYINDNYKKTIYELKKIYEKEDELVILPTYYYPLFWYHWQELNTSQNKLLSLTKRLEKNLYKSSFNLNKPRQHNLFIVINYSSFLTKTEKDLVKNFSNLCKTEKVDEATQVIFCLKDN